MAKRRSPQLNSPSLPSARRQPAPADPSFDDSPADALASDSPAAQGTHRHGLSATDNPNGQLPAGELPGAGLRRLISVAILLHGFCLLLALSSNLAPSYLQGRLLKVFAPYLNATHQYYHALPLELTRAEPLDFPLHVELQLEAADDDPRRLPSEWQPLPLAGILGDSRPPAGASDSRWDNLGRWLALLAIDEPDSELLSDFAARAVEVAEGQSGQRYQAVRLVTAKVLSYDEDLTLAGNLPDPEDENFQASVLYSAQILRLDNSGGGDDSESQRLKLIPRQEALRTAKPVDFVKELP